MVMVKRSSYLAGCLLGASLALASAQTPDPVRIRQVKESAEPARAAIRIRAAARSPHPIPANITGKFAEHLYYNVVNGMDAQILRNPTFADFPLSSGEMSPDGIAKFLIDEQLIGRRLRDLATRHGWPNSELDGLVEGRRDGLATLWTRVGHRGEVKVSPDTGPYGGRAQRVQVAQSNQGIAQWTYLPLHRVRRYEFEIFARSPNSLALSLSLTARESASPCVTTPITGLSPDWKKLTGSFEVPENVPSDEAFKLALTGGGPGQFVVRHCLLRPADHRGGSDPDVIRLLRESHLPLLRWPGGNFVSGYHWEDGIGPIERRPSRPNYAWGEIEPNLFGTDEFIAFCRAVGCEPMICVNSGDGTPEEAARWVEYCNGPVTSPMGARRAANGHPEPYGITHWEVGNELWGRWQFHWTTAAGNVDRYQQFSKAMRAADPTIRLQACGAPVFWGKQWNDTLIAGAAPLFQTITDHPLIGGDVPPSTEPLAVFRDFMAVPEVLEHKWAELREDMLRGGIREPRLAVTELQLFAHIARSRDGGEPARLTGENLVAPPTLAEGLYDVLIYHAAIRLAPFIEMITHSATVNHGGGLRKIRERVFANPCHHAQAAFAAFAGATPVGVEIEAATEHAPLVLPQLREATREASFAAVDALAALAPDGSLLISLVHRGSSGPVQTSIVLDGFQGAETAEVNTLSADVPWAVNTLEKPDNVAPITSTVSVANSQMTLDLKPYSVVRVRVPGKK